MSEAYFELGRIREKKGQQNEAVLAYEHAVKLDPTQEKYHYRLMVGYRAIGEPQKAKREFQIFERLHTANEAKYGPKTYGAPQDAHN